MLFGGVKPLNADKSLNSCMNAVREMRAGLVPFTIVRPGGRPALVEPAPPIAAIVSQAA